MRAACLGVGGLPGLQAEAGPPCHLLGQRWCCPPTCKRASRCNGGSAGGPALRPRTLHIPCLRGWCWHTRQARHDRRWDCCAIAPSPRSRHRPSLLTRSQRLQLHCAACRLQGLCRATSSWWCNNAGCLCGPACCCWGAGWRLADWPDASRRKGPGLLDCRRCCCWTD